MDDELDALLGGPSTLATTTIMGDHGSLMRHHPSSYATSSSQPTMHHHVPIAMTSATARVPQLPSSLPSAMVATSPQGTTANKFREAETGIRTLPNSRKRSRTEMTTGTGAGRSSLDDVTLHTVATRALTVEKQIHELQRVLEM